MLIVIYGPSGVGKSTVIKRLVEVLGWRRVRTVSTRGTRPADDRTRLSHEEFESQRSRGQLAHVNCFYGHYYASLAEDLIAGSKPEPRTTYVVDMSIKRPLPRGDFPHIAVVLLPRDEDQLRQRLRSAGRVERERDALVEYRTIYLCPGELLERLGEPTFVLENSGSIDRVVDEIARLASKTVTKD